MSVTDVGWAPPGGRFKAIKKWPSLNEVNMKHSALYFAKPHPKRYIHPTVINV